MLILYKQHRLLSTYYDIGNSVSLFPSSQIYYNSLTIHESTAYTGQLIESYPQQF